MAESSVQNSVRYVVSDKHAGAVLPGNRAEMWRDIYLEPGAQVGGGIFGNNITVHGSPAAIEGGVYGRGAIKITCSAKDKSSEETVDFGSVVTASESLLIEDHVPYRTRFFADIFADQINITNAFVRGNIYARRAIVKNSVILGGIFCKDKLTLNNTVLSTFRAGEVVLSPEIMLFYPFALAEKAIKIDFPVKSLSFTNLVKMAEDSQNDETEAVFMNQSDVICVNETENDRPVSFHMLSLGSRILDIEDLKNAFLENKRYLEMISLGDHLKPSEKHNFKHGELAGLEKTFFRLLANPPQKEGAHKAPLSEMASRENILRFLDQIKAYGT